MFQYLEGHAVARHPDPAWVTTEDKLESFLLDMFNRTDPMKGWELKKMAANAWRNVTKDLKELSRTSQADPTVVAETSNPVENILVYNR